MFLRAFVHIAAMIITLQHSRHSPNMAEGTDFVHWELKLVKQTSSAFSRICITKSIQSYSLIPIIGGQISSNFIWQNVESLNDKAGKRERSSHLAVLLS